MSSFNQDDNLKPEELARVLIDAKLTSVGWHIINRDQYICDKTQIVRENLMQGGKEADYVIFINGKVIGVIEAKRKEIDVSTLKVRSQVDDYAHLLLATDPYYYNPIPFRYTSNGEDIYFQNILSDNKQWVKIKDFHSDVELLHMFYSIQRMPELNVTQGLRVCQLEAIKNIEASIREGKKRSLAVLATGAGKTYLACALSYRLLKYAHFRKILFLVDRNNLGRQTEIEFSSFTKTDNNQVFTNIYEVCRLQSPNITSSSNVVISTIQRLFSVLTGKKCAFNDDAEDLENEAVNSDISDDNDLSNETVDLAQTLLPNDYFDLIIVDECHRSIYKKWRKVLEHFNKAFIVGITATPIPDTVAFFNNNIVSEYSYEKSVVDRVNVDSRIYRIKTVISEETVSTVDIGEKYTQIGVYNNSTEQLVTDSEKQYAKHELNRAVIYEDQIRKILQEYKKIVYSKLYPERSQVYEYLPKTLIFALNERHARTIVQVAKEVFNEQCVHNDMFVQQITYSIPNNANLIKTFRNDQKTRIAVTVNLISTGTDIKALEVVLFLRDVQSEATYIQMKGRGCRTISDDALRNITPNADGKECYYIVDAVGVTEHPFKVLSTVLENGNAYNLPLKLLLEQIARGYLPDENLKLIAQKALRLDYKANDEQKNKFTTLAGVDLHTFAENIYQAFEQQRLPPFINVNEANYERKRLVRHISENYEAREYMLILNAGFVDIHKTVVDTIIESNFSYDKAEQHVTAFKQYIEDNKDKVEALRIIYNQENTPITRAMIEDLHEKIKLQLSEFSISTLWSDFKLLKDSKDRVVALTKKMPNHDYDAITNLIQLVRFAIGRLTELRSIVSTYAQYFELWCGKRHRTVTPEQKELLKQIADYIAYNGAFNYKQLLSVDKELAIKLLTTFTDVPRVKMMQSANDTIESLSDFLLNNQFKKFA